MRKILHTVRKSIFHVEDLGYLGRLFTVRSVVFCTIRSSASPLNLIGESTFFWLFLQSYVLTNRRYRLLGADAECLY